LALIIEVFHLQLYQNLFLRNPLKLIASVNQYITNKGLVIAFSNEKEFDDFTKVFDKDLVDNFFNSKSSKGSLFKE
jgi:hypothetical protein